MGSSCTTVNNAQVGPDYIYRGPVWCEALLDAQVHVPRVGHDGHGGVLPSAQAVKAHQLDGLGAQQRLLGVHQQVQQRVHAAHLVERDVAHRLRRGSLDSGFRGLQTALSSGAALPPPGASEHLESLPRLGMRSNLFAKHCPLVTGPATMTMRPCSAPSKHLSRARQQRKACQAISPLALPNLEP